MNKIYTTTLLGWGKVPNEKGFPNLKDYFKSTLFFFVKENIEVLKGKKDLEMAID